MTEGCRAGVHKAGANGRVFERTTDRIANSMPQLVIVLFSVQIINGSIG